jgi:hypothetical protein
MASINFDHTIRLFNQYCSRRQVAVDQSFNGDLAAEAGKRLEQLNWILRRVALLEAKDEELRQQLPSHEIVDEESRTIRQEINKRSREISTELGILSEAFYYFAWRAREVLKLLPNLKQFDCEGVRNVRNHLLEHAEKHGQIYINALSYGGEQGPTLKAFRFDEQGNFSVREENNLSHDRGLYVNAAEFRDNLKKRLSNILTLCAADTVQPSTSKS